MSSGLCGEWPRGLAILGSCTSPIDPAFLKSVTLGIGVHIDKWTGIQIAPYWTVRLTVAVWVLALEAPPTEIV